MARKASEKPWFHSSSGFWCATVNGKREYLATREHPARDRSGFRWTKDSERVICFGVYGYTRQQLQY